MKILFAGDVMLGRSVNDVLRNEPPDFPWGDTLPLFNEADLRICNIECVISDLGEPWSETPKVFHFRSDAKNVSVLREAGMDIVSLANNHAIDYGYDAMLDCLKRLDQVGIGHAGAGKNFEEVCAPTFARSGGIKIGFIAFTDNEERWEATFTKPGVFFVPISLQDRRATQLLEMVTKIRSEVDLFIVSAHWGGNWGCTPSPSHVEFGHALVEAGADVIFGHSCHIFRGIEIYRGCPVLYSTGDFVDDYAVDETERNDQSFIFMVETNGPKIGKLQLYPTVIRQFQARRADESQSAAIAGKMISLCNELGTTASWNPTGRCLEIPVLQPV